MGIKRKKKLDVQVSTRELIIDEAERIVASHGLEGLKLDDIADILGIRRPSLYTHFDGRDGILTALAERTFISLSQQFQDDEDEDPVVTLSKGVDELVDFLAQHKAYACLLARDFATPGGLPAVNAVLGSKDEVPKPVILKPLYKRLDTILARGRKLGKFDKTDSYLFLSTMIGAIMTNLLQHRRTVKNLNRRMIKLAIGMVSVSAD